MLLAYQPTTESSHRDQRASASTLALSESPPFTQMELIVACCPKITVQCHADIEPVLLLLLLFRAVSTSIREKPTIEPTTRVDLALRDHAKQLKRKNYYNIEFIINKLQKRWRWLRFSDVFVINFKASSPAR